MAKRSKAKTVAAAAAAPRRVIARGRYDAAQTTDHNRRHFAAADAFSPDEANNLGVRTILRNRCRYVAANNSRVKGMIRTLAKHTVGTGPRLQMLLGSGPVAARLNQRIEEAFVAWAREIQLAKKLRIMRAAKVHTGEVFAIKTINPKLRSPIKLDVQVVEADQVTAPYGQPWNERDVDGIRFDEFGNRHSYQILKVHPGDAFRGIATWEHQELSARFVTHYYADDDRPAVHRGVPEMTPAVQVFEEARRFRAAVLGAAETAADFAMAIQTDAAPGEEVDEMEPMDTFELERRMATTLPKGWKLTQTKAEHPTTTFNDFDRHLLSECARCIEMPLTIASLDSSKSNMSSAYLDYQPYANAIAVERSDLELFLDDLFEMFRILLQGITGGRRLRDYPHTWFWPFVGEHADPSKVAAAQEKRLANNLTTLSDEYAKRGLDWETQLRQRAREKALQKELGLTDAQAMLLGTPAKASEPEEEDTDEE